MQDSHLISVIMPVYNCEKYVKIAIDSVLNQSYPNFELLISNDCSTDGTKAILDTYSDSRIKRFDNVTNKGYLKTCNDLASKAKGEYFTFLDADDINHLKRLEIQLNYLENNPNIDMVGSNIIRIDSDGNEISQSNFVLSNDDIKVKTKNYLVPVHYSSLLIKKHVIDDIGLYNEYFDRVGSEDVYWFSRAIEKYTVNNIKEVLYYYRKHNTSVTATHTNPKAKYAGHLAIHLYNNRIQDKEDYILSDNLKKADACGNYIMSFIKIKKSLFLGVFYFIVAFIKSPSLLSEFFNEFATEFKNKFVTFIRL